MPFSKATAPVGNRITAILIPAIVGAAGMVLAFHPTLGSGFALMQTDPGDTLFNNYLLEHSWQWLTGGERSPAFWHPPAAHPVPNVLAFSDVMVSFAPLYWLGRVAGADALLSCQLWMLTMGLINYVLAFLFLKRGAGFGPVAAALGAYVFAFGSSRVNQLGHPQLLPQVFVLAAVWAGWVMHQEATADRPGSARARRAVGWLFAAMTAQMYGAFYMGYFLALVGGALGLGLAVHPSSRPQFLRLLSVNRAWIGACAAVSLAALGPLILHYSQALGQVPERFPESARDMLLFPESFGYMGPRNLFYGWTTQQWPFDSLREPTEQAIGLGLITSIVLVIALVQNRRAVGVQVAWGVAAGLTLLFLRLESPVEFELWPATFHVVPGMPAIRAPVRIGLFLLLPAAIALAWFMERGGPAKHRPLVLLAGLACCLEQTVVTSAFDTHAVRHDVQSVTRRIEPGDDAFLLLTANSRLPHDYVHVLALLAQQETGVPTLNLYSGNTPQGWHFGYVSMSGPVELPELERSVHTWLQSQGLANTRPKIIVLEGNTLLGMNYR
jgi:hypothetical protein